MSDTDCPSQNIIHVYTKSETEAAIKADPTVSLWDFHMFERQYEYWYCPICKRVHQLDIGKRRIWRTFRPVKATRHSFHQAVQGWEELFIFSDTDIDYATEMDFGITLSDFINNSTNAYQFRISPKNDVIEAYSRKTLMPALAYIVETEYTDADVIYGC